MKLTWLYHHDLTTEEADQLISRYTSRNVPTQRTLSTDPRLWVVAALLPEFRNVPRVDRRYQQRIFQ
jgi:hypothetical protein